MSTKRPVKNGEAPPLFDLPRFIARKMFRALQYTGDNAEKCKMLPGVGDGYRVGELEVSVSPSSLRVKKGDWIVISDAGDISITDDSHFQDDYLSLEDDRCVTRTPPMYCQALNGANNKRYMVVQYTERNVQECALFHSRLFCTPFGRLVFRDYENHIVCVGKGDWLMLASSGKLSVINNKLFKCFFKLEDKVKNAT